MDDLDKLDDKIARFKSEHAPEKSGEDRENAQRSVGMRAGSEFMAYIVAGGLTGGLAGHFFGNLPLWLIVMMFAGFGMGTYRAYVAMNKND